MILAHIPRRLLFTYKYGEGPIGQGQHMCDYVRNVSKLYADYETSLSAMAYKLAIRPGYMAMLMRAYYKNV